MAIEIKHVSAAETRAALAYTRRVAKDKALY